MSQYKYPSISPGSDSIRLLRLMPNNNERLEKTEIHCELFEYTLQDPGNRIHLYEALSYTWGDSDDPDSIFVNKQKFDVTKNLHTALVHLQDRYLERILWVDAICINQQDTDEQSQQVQRMAKIYSKAARVLVWLGETAGNSDTAPGSDVAMETIRIASEDKYTTMLDDKAIQQAVLALLGRAWFQRIWVLQEVAAARHILIMCGTSVIDGYIFYLGVTNFYEAHPDLDNLIRPVTSLIKGAIFRPKHALGLINSTCLSISPLGELIDMFHTHKASLLVDKVYALLAMSSDDPDKAGLLPNYNVPWKEVFKGLVKFVLSQDVSVQTSEASQRAVIKSNGCVLGQISSVRSDDRQYLKIISKSPGWDLDDETEWIFQASANPIRERDIVCLLEGASKPTIIRLCKDYFAVVVVAAAPLNENGIFRSLATSLATMQSSQDFLLVWDLETPLAESQGQEEFEIQIRSNSQALEYSRAEPKDYLNKATRLWNTAMILDDLKWYDEADQILPEARNCYMTAYGKKHLPGLSTKYGRTPLSFLAGEGHADVIKLLLAEKLNVDSEDRYGRTPLLWAAINGHETIVKLLLESGAKLDSKDRFGRTPLWWAAKNRHEAVVTLLLKKGANLESKLPFEQTPLLWAASNGYAAVVKLLLEKGAKLESKDRFGRTPLWWAVKNRHEAVAMLLLERGAKLKSKD